MFFKIVLVFNAYDRRISIVLKDTLLQRWGYQHVCDTSEKADNKFSERIIRLKTYIMNRRIVLDGSIGTYNGNSCLDFSRKHKLFKSFRYLLIKQKLSPGEL